MQPQTTDYLAELGAEISKMMSLRGGFLVGLAWQEFALIAGFVMILFLINTAVSARSGIFDMAGFITLLGKMAFASIFLTGYAAFAELPMDLAQGIATKLTEGRIDEVMKATRNIMTGMEKPNFTNITDVIMYWITMFSMGSVSVVLFAANSYAYLMEGMCVLFGPLFIPLLMTKHFAGKFFGWIGLMVNYAMLTPVIAGLTFIWSDFFMWFFQHSLAGDYSIAHFLKLFVTVLMMVVSFAFTMFRLPHFTTELFGGAGHAGAGISNSILVFTRSIVTRVAARA